MPIALLLQETTLAFAFGANKMSPWVHLVAVEEKLIDRARSAFLVRWFGRGLPLHGFHLRIAIENLEQLRDRYVAAAKSVQPELSGINLTEPLAGAVGQLAGMALSPTGLILLTAALVRKMKTWLGVLLGVLAALVSPAVTGLGLGIVIGVGTPVSLVGGILAGFTGEERTGAVIGLLGALAMLFNSARLFLEQLLGPREKVANPVLKQMLGIFDHLAGLVVQLLGFIAVVVTEIGPRLLPLALQIRPFIALIESVLETLKFIWKDLLDHLLQFLDPKYFVLRTIDIVVDAISQLIPGLIDSFTAFFKSALAALKGIFKGLEGVAGEPAKAGKPKTIGTGFHGLIETVSDWLDDAVKKSPLMVNVGAAKKVFAMASDALSDKSKSSSPSTFPNFPKVALTPASTIEAALGGEPFLGLSAIEPLGKIDDFLHGWLLGAAPPLSDEAVKQLERARHPASAFAAEKQQLRESLGGRTPESVLAEQLASQQTLRTLIAGVMGRILPPESRTSMADAYASIDAALYGAKKEPKADFPVRDIPDNGLLRPIVRRLILHSAGGEKLDMQDFADRVRKALLAQPYPAPATA